MDQSSAASVTGTSKADIKRIGPNSSSRDNQSISTEQGLNPQLPISSQWPGCIRDFLPILLNHDEAARDMAEMEKNFSKQTAVRVLARVPDRSSEVREMVLDNHNSVDIRQLWKRSTFFACFVNRFILRPGVSDSPKDRKRLRISGRVFRWLLAGFDASPSLVSSLINAEILTGLGSRVFTDGNGDSVFTCWYTLPVRTAVPCLDEEGAHALSTAGSNQMDPNGYLHLGDIAHDIRVSRIGVYARCDKSSCRMLFVDFQDGRLHELANEPFDKIRELSKHSSLGSGEDHILPNVHAALFSSSTRWWSHALTQLKIQLIYHQIRLLEESGQTPKSHELDLDSSARHLELKKTLHSVMSHLQRYKTELQVTRNIVVDLQTKLSQYFNDMGKPDPRDIERFVENLHMVAKHISALEAFIQELETKTGTIMELLSEVVKWRNDVLLVNNGILVQKLLKSSRMQTKSSQGMMEESHQMAKDMRKDSVSMKTIALLTMAFLPATSFAAVLSMPFFNQEAWLSDPAKIWLWVVLTIPTTALSAFVYFLFTRKELKRNAQSSQGDQGDEIESIDFVPQD